MTMIDAVLVAAAVFVAVRPIPEDGTEVQDPVAPTAPVAEPTPEAAPKETPEEIHARARKPPKDGPCKRCGLDKPLNRLFLCYPCWVKVELEKKGWKEGQPHPADCRCDVECAFDKGRGGFGN